MNEEIKINKRPRRLRGTSSIRSLTQENHLNVRNFVYPLFIRTGKNQKTNYQ